MYGTLETSEKKPTTIAALINTLADGNYNFSLFDKMSAAQPRRLIHITIYTIAQGFTFLLKASRYIYSGECMHAAVDARHLKSYIVIFCV